MYGSNFYGSDVSTGPQKDTHRVSNKGSYLLFPSLSESKAWRQIEFKLSEIKSILNMSVYVQVCPITKFKYLGDMIKEWTKNSYVKKSTKTIETRTN